MSLLEQALTLHRRGDLAEAAARYGEVLRIEPDNADAHYYLGTMLCQQGRFAEGAEHARRSIASNPEHARAQILLGRALNALGLHDEALAAFERAIALAPESADAYSHYADALSEVGKYAEAVAHYDRALALAPNTVADLFNRGLALAALGQHAEALADFDRVVAAAPRHAPAHVQRAKALAEQARLDAALKAVDAALAIDRRLADAWLGRGNLLHGLKRHDDAIAAYRAALALKNDLAEAWVGLGNALRDLNRFDEALEAYDRAVAVAPGLSAGWLGRGNLLFAREQYNFAVKSYDDALAAYDRALAIDPSLTGALHGRGNIFHELRRPQEALAAYDKALEFNPGFADAWLGRGNVLYSLQRDAEAVECYDKAISLNVDLAQAYYGKALARLSQGAYDEGWRLYEWRWRSRLPTARPRGFDRPLWLGERALHNETILIHSEQGLGDTIQFCRYLDLFKSMTCRVYLEAPEALVSLLRERHDWLHIFARGEPLPEFDFHCPLMSLPLAFGTTLSTVPAAIPYLFVADEKRKAWRGRVGDGSKRRIGVAWSGNLHPDPGRSVPLEMLASILTDGVEWHCLQKEIRQEERGLLPGCTRIVDHSQMLVDFSDTAALVAEMDTVISIDTAVAHLAGALGKEVWIMLPFHADFRWLRGRSDSPWYPTAELFRQSRPNDWTRVLKQIASRIDNESRPGRP